MEIKKHYEVPAPSRKGPHQYYGRFVCSVDDEREHNHIALFAESVWRQYGNEKCAVSFVPSFDSEEFWVNAQSKLLVREVIDSAIDNLQQAFKKVKLSPIRLEKIIEG